MAGHGEFAKRCELLFDNRPVLMEFTNSDGLHFLSETGFTQGLKGSTRSDKTRVWSTRKSLKPCHQPK